MVAPLANPAALRTIHNHFFTAQPLTHPTYFPEHKFRTKGPLNPAVCFSPPDFALQLSAFDFPTGEPRPKFLSPATMASQAESSHIREIAFTAALRHWHNVIRVP
jgi:hypothetical protein